MIDASRRGAALARSVWAQADRLLHEIAKFGVVGIGAFIIDIGLFNLLRFAGGEGPMYDKPLTAKIVSVVVATTFAYFARGEDPSALQKDLTFSFGGGCFSTEHLTIDLSIGVTYAHGDYEASVVYPGVTWLFTRHIYGSLRGIVQVDPGWDAGVNPAIGYETNVLDDLGVFVELQSTSVLARGSPDLGFSIAGGPVMVF